MDSPDLQVDILVLSIQKWLQRKLPSWATATRFHARRLEHEDTLVQTAYTPVGDVGYAIFDQHMSHLHYIETRKEHRGMGVAEQLWERIRREAKRPEITAMADSEDGKRRLLAWGFTEANGDWTCKDV